MALFHCPQCGSIVEATAGESARCRDCGFQGQVNAEGAELSPSAPPVALGAGLLTPFAFLSALVGVGTFYLSDFGLPLVASLTSIVLGWSARRREPRNGLALAAMLLGGVGIVLAGIHFAIA